MNNNQIKVLYIEDDPVDQEAFRRDIKMQKLPYDYLISGTIADAKQQLAEHPFDIIISDYKLPDGEATEILKMNLPTPIIITTGTGSENIAVQTMQAGAYDYLIKDYDRNYLLLLPSIIERVLEQKKGEEQIAMLSETVKNIADGVLITDMTGNILFVNDALCHLFGFEEKELLDHHLNTLFSAAPLNDESNLFQSLEIVQNKKNGTQFSAIASRTFVFNAKKQKIASVTTLKDITLWNIAKEEMRKKSEELVKAKTELEQLNIFSFVSTHDLQEPLHKILVFSNLMNTDADVELSGKGKNYLNTIMHSVEELRQFITQIQDYSKIATEGNNFQEVDLSEVVKIALEKADADSAQAVIQVEPLPIIQADKQQMITLFYNLIKNGLIYRDKTKPPHITIKYKPCLYESVEITVEDNGIGIEEKYFDRIFQPFQRLHRSNEYPGRGLGLAICGRILLRHQGAISVNSTVGKGSTFIVKIPLSLKKE